MEKLPFLVAIFLLPYQMVRIFRSTSYNKRYLEVLIGAFIIPLCLTFWPIYLNFRFAFSIISGVFSAIMLCEFIRVKNLVYLATAIFLLIVSALFLLMKLFDFSSL